MGSIGASDRTPIREALVRDQAGLCAYCQRRIWPGDDPRTGLSQMKIEHWNARAEFRDQQFTWSNLLGVCTGRAPDLEQSSGLRLHCDASRGTVRLFLHPVRGRGGDPRHHLRYTKGGIVESAQPDTRVDADIAALKLNAPHIRRGREAVFDAAWGQLKRVGFAVRELRRLENAQRIVPGNKAPEHAEFLGYHLRKKLRNLGEHV